MKTNPKNSQEIIHFLIELRSRLIFALIILFIAFAIALCFANNLYTYLALPLLKYLPQGHLIATQIVSPFFVPFKLAFLVAVSVTAPFFLYQLWGFIAPALYGHEKKLLWPFLLVSVFLFYAGIAFAYFIIFPMLFHFLADIVPQGVELSPDISAYLDFTVKILLMFGTLFEIPIAMFLLVTAGWVSQARLVRFRSFAIVGSFILGMLFAPPDVISQTVMALPIWFLYEIGLFFCRFAKDREACKEK